MLKFFVSCLILLFNAAELFSKDIDLFSDQLIAAGEVEFPDKKELSEKLKPQVSHPLEWRMYPLQECLTPFRGNRIDMLGWAIILLLY